MNKKKLWIAALTLGSFVSGGQAQVMEKRTLTLDGARTAIAAGITEARSKNAPGAVIAVVDDGGNLMALERLDDTFAAGANISIGKARTAALFKRPTKAFEEIIRSGRTSMIALNDFTPLQGGIPIMIGDQVAGGIGVSGAASAQQDEEIAIAGAVALQSMKHMGMKPPSSAVTYLEGKKVDAAFAKGMPLVEVKDYKIHASRREGPGMAEVHERDTDIIYVLDGAATIVTGGSVPDLATTAPEELRGSTIRDGQTKLLSKGNVMIVPNGTPHWFQQVQGPFTYYVVKVRSQM